LLRRAQSIPSRPGARHGKARADRPLVAGRRQGGALRLTLQVEDGDKTLTAKYRMHAYECANSFESPQSDFTSARGNDELVLKVASPRGRILGHDVDTSMSQRYIDSDHADDIFEYDPPNPVEKLRFVGDTEGDEAGTETGVFITFREISVELETCAPLPPTTIVNPPPGPATAPSRP
jgi:hypothetical protein